jgi:mitogen-activated protein kinase kinase kinase
VRNRLRGAPGSQDLLENWYLFASEHGQHAQKLMDRATMTKFDRLLIKLAISWVSFICDDCDPAERRTFRWAVNALEFTLSRTRRDNILRLPEEEFNQMRTKVASCMTLLISHFDILGARSNLEAKREKERLKEMVRLHSTGSEADNRSPSPNPDDAINYGPYAYTDSGIRKFWEKISVSLQHLDATRTALGSEQRVVGRVLDNEKPEDRSLVFLASSSSNISIRWQQGRFIGAGAFGSVYTAVNMDSGSLMAVKEIKFQELTGIPNLFAQIKEELRVMEMLHHPNVVEYYGIEVSLIHCSFASLLKWHLLPGTPGQSLHLRRVLSGWQFSLVTRAWPNRRRTYHPSLYHADVGRPVLSALQRRSSSRYQT